jgi:16S rRNA (cytosine967-C5)-methyltransferase
MTGSSTPRLRPTHFGLAQQALAEILRLARPADVVVQALFRERPQMGSRDRAGVSALVYGVLRDFQRLQAQVGADAAALCAAWLLQSGGHDASQLAALGYDDAAVVAQALERFDQTSLSKAQCLNLPDWLHASLLAQYGAEETPALAAALNQPASFDLRVNSLRASREQARARLASEGIASEPTPLSPLGLRLPKRAPLQATRAFRDGWIEPQDEGSQLLGFLLAPKPGEAVVDYCAGAGGKTLALGALMNNQGRLYAFDVSEHRLAKLDPREKRSGLSIVHRHVLDGTTETRLQRLEAQCDAVLVDAPCTSTGALRRNPELRLRTPDLQKFQIQQGQILEAGSRLLRPGGRLVYATCSLSREENEDVVQQFLAGQSDFEIEDAGAVLRTQGISYEGGLLKLLPHRHGTDGFFGALLRKRSRTMPP